MGMPLPDDNSIHLVGIVAKNVNTFSETPTPEVAAAISKACDTVCTFFSKNNSPGAEAA
jgi:hypothetical protein